MPKLSRTEGIEALYRAKEELERTDDKRATLNVLADAGSTVGYKPTFRALVMGQTPEVAIKWR